MKKTLSVSPIVLSFLCVLFILGGCTQESQTTPSDVTSENAENQETLENENENQVETVEVEHKPFLEYVKAYQNYLFDNVKKDSIPSEIQLKNLIVIHEVKVACPENADGPCGIPLLIMGPKDWDKAGAQTFFFAHDGATGMRTYYGPFEDDLQKIIEEAKQVKEIEDPSKETPNQQSKIFLFHASTYKKKPVNSENVPKDLTEIYSLSNTKDCGENSDGACGSNVFIMGPQDWNKAGIQTFYFAESGGAGVKEYFGPFQDDLKRIVEEAKSYKELP